MFNPTHVVCGIVAHMKSCCLGDIQMWYSGNKPGKSIKFRHVSRRYSEFLNCQVYRFFLRNKSLWSNKSKHPADETFVVSWVLETRRFIHRNNRSLVSVIMVGTPVATKGSVSKQDKLRLINQINKCSHPLTSRSHCGSPSGFGVDVAQQCSKFRIMLGSDLSKRRTSTKTGSRNTLVIG